VRNEDLDQLLSGFDPYNDRHFARMPEAMEYSRNRCPVVHSQVNGGAYLVTRFADLKAVLSDPETFSSREAGGPSPLPLVPFTADPPLHNQFRKVVNRFFTRPYLRRHEDIMREIARSTIERFVDRGKLEVMGEFALPFNAATVAQIVFDEDDEERLNRIIPAVERCAWDPSSEAYQGVAEIAAEYMAERAAMAAKRDDLLSAIINGTVDDRPMTQEEQLGMVTILFIASLDTTRAAISNIAAAVATQPELEARLRNPDWIRNDLEEFLRWQSPVIFLHRAVAKDVELGGVQLREGDELILMYNSANRDKAEFPDADHLNFDEHHRQHLAFGFGIHRCLGSTLAQIQISIAFDELFKRITNLRLAGPDSGPVYQPGMTFCPSKLVLAFDRVEG
jgi:cytochrome P450